ncbi:TonB-dependent receptor [Aurantiacibacter gangjinensis]|uniref:TonB-dependent receptor n=1 Tax=Aurantiacibacter gangjinensis TaxID=502682 RepID=UPI00069B474C|nr:TonB-dependent receptor [Aurantiacibacter gangjinensis]APE27410.1 Outer membrane receptor proteins, mostly Fe transport [Aurantiacibacter gangjinensis]
MNSIVPRRLLAAASLPVVAVATAAQAQSVSPGESASQDEVAPEDRVIVVTAQKREQDLTDVPASITVFDGEALENIGAVDFEDYAKYIPGLGASSQGGPGQRQLILRGVNAGDDPASTVGVYVDEAPVGSSTSLATGGRLGFELVPFDIERIEVLRGPQGTIYGASTLGGLLKYVTRAPDLDEFEGRADASVFAVDNGGLNYTANAALNVPIAGVAGLRFTGFYARDDGFVDNVVTGVEDINGNERYGGRAQLLVEPGPNVSLRAAALYQRTEQDDSALVRYDFATGEPVFGELENDRTVAAQLTQDFQQYSLTADFDFGFATLTSVSAYSELETPAIGDATASFGAAFGSTAVALLRAAETEKFVQELRLTSASRADGMPLEWQVGLFYTEEDSLNDQILTVRDGPFVPLNPAAVVELPTSYEEFAVFANTTVFFGDRVSLNLGLRIAENEQSFSQSTSGPAVGLPPGVVSTVTNESSDGTATFVVAPNWQITDDVTLYARAASGYRPGGPNAILPDPANPGESLVPLTFDPDTLWNYEAGVKGNFGNSGTFGLAAFRIDWDDIQIIQIVNGATFRGNGDTARSQGVEAEIAFEPVEGLTLGGNVVYTDAELTADTGVVVGGRDGDRLPLVPEWAATAFADYTFPLSDTIIGNVGATVSYTDDRRSGFPASLTNPSFTLDDYLVVDLRASVDFDSFSVSAFAKNLTNEIPQLGATNVGGRLDVAVGRPRAFGLLVAADF